MPLCFVDEPFPLGISLGASVRIEKRAQVSSLLNGAEVRNAIWKAPAVIMMWAQACAVQQICT